METEAVLYVDEKRCSGCGVCADVCAAGAIALRGGRASIDQDLCTRCGSCFIACPEEAILAVIEPSVALQEASHNAIPKQLAVPSGSIAARVAPAVGAALLFIGREVVPHLATHVLHALERRVNHSPARVGGPGEISSGAASVGHRHRRRRRGE